jgi:hypothetical protein
MLDEGKGRLFSIKYKFCNIKNIDMVNPNYLGIFTMLHKLYPMLQGLNDCYRSIINDCLGIDN